MAKIGRLNVEVGATNKTKSGLFLASRDISRWAKQTRKATLGVAGLAFKGVMAGFAGIAASGAAAGTALGYLANKSIEAIGDANDFSKSIGISYNGLRELQKGAELSGVDLATTNVALMKMSDTLGSAFGGNQAAIDSVRNIGLSVKDLQRMNPEQQFLAIAEAVDRIKDPSQKIAAARDIFGRSGGALISFFKNARGDINEASKAIKTFGIGLDQIDVEKIDTAGDAMGEWKFIVEGLGNQLARKFAPLITDVSERFVKAIDDAGGMGKAVDTAFTFGVGAVGDMLDKVEDLELSWMKATKAVNDFYLNLYKHDPNDKITKDRNNNMTERRLQGIPEHRREQARKLLEKQGGFANEDPNSAAWNEQIKLQEEFDKRSAEIAARKEKRGTLGARFIAWEQQAQMKGTADAGEKLGDAAKDRLATEEDVTKELKAQKGIQDAGQGSLSLIALNGIPLGPNGKGKGAATAAKAKAASSEGEAKGPVAPGVAYTPSSAIAPYAAAPAPAASGPGLGSKEYFDNVLGLGGAAPEKPFSMIPNYASKRPTGQPKWMSKIPDGGNVGRAGAGGADMSETNHLLRDVVSALRGGVKGVYA